MTSSQVIPTATSTTQPFQPSIALQTPKATTQQLISSLSSGNTLSEGKFWSKHYGFGDFDGKKQKFAHFREANVQAGTASMVHDLQMVDNLLLVACGPRVRLYGTSNQSPLIRQLSQHGRMGHQHEIVADSQLSTQGQLAGCCRLRWDGRLAAVGTAQGRILVMDVSTKATLVTFNATNLAVRSLQWFRNGQHLASVGDDATLRVYSLKQLSNQACVMECQGHGDAIRSVQLWRDEWAFTGSYDHTIRIWKVKDVESKEQEDRCWSVLHHGAPVETLLLIPRNDQDCWLLSAGGTCVKVWNPKTGTCVCEPNVFHRKTITSLLWIPQRSCLFTAGLDGLLRMSHFDVESGQCHLVYNYNFHEAISSLAFNQDKNRLAIGGVNGRVWVRQAGVSLTQNKRQREPRAGTFGFFMRGQNASAGAEDYIVSAMSGKKRKLAPFDQSLQQFRHGQALDQALSTRVPSTVVAVLEELGKRQGLKAALQNRNEEALEPLLSFVVRYIARPRFTPILMGVAHLLLDLYVVVADESEVIAELLFKLSTQVKEEIRAQKSLLRVVGQLDAILSKHQDDDEED